MEQWFFKTIIDWVEDSNQSVWNVCIKFDTWIQHWKMYVLLNDHVVINEKSVERKPFINRESKKLELTI